MEGEREPMTLGAEPQPVLISHSQHPPAGDGPLMNDTRNMALICVCRCAAAWLLVAGRVCDVVRMRAWLLGDLARE